MDYRVNGSLWKVYAARDYSVAHPCIDNKVEVNIPEHAPTLPQDDNYTAITLHRGYFINSNYPSVPGIIKSSHSIVLPLAQGTSCPIYFPKGTPFLLTILTGKIEEGFLIYLGGG